MVPHHSYTDTDERPYMGIMAMGGALVLLWGFVFERFFSLAIPFYLPLGLLCFSGSAMVRHKRLGKSPDLIFLVVSLVALIHHLFLIELNNYHPYFMISSMLAISLATLASSRLGHILAMVAVPLVYLGSVSVLAPSQPRILMFMAVASISAVIYYISFERRAWSERSKSDQRLIEVHRARSIESVKMAALGEMAGGIAHEVNNPLAIIAGKAEQLERKVQQDVVTPAELLQGLQAIQNTVQRIVKIVRGLRSFARDVTQDPLENIRVEGLIEETLNFCRARFKHDGIEITVRTESPGLMVPCRSTQISQVLLNLLNNARDAVEVQESKWIKITTRVEGEFVVIRVEDSGGGIAPAVQGKIFQPFFTTKPVGKGTGLGLSVCKGIMDSHRGFIRIDPTSPTTEFLVGMPLKRSVDLA